MSHRIAGTMRSASSFAPTAVSPAHIASLSHPRAFGPIAAAPLSAVRHDCLVRSPVQTSFTGTSYDRWGHVAGGAGICGGLALLCGATQKRRRGTLKKMAETTSAKTVRLAKTLLDVTPPPRVPVVLLSGFLGTGKTTLLKHWLQNFEGRIGVVVNDVASVNIDAKLVKQQGKGTIADVDTIQLENGCVCCSLGDELLLTIFELMSLAKDGNPFSYIVVELSGVAEPARIKEMFERAEISDSPVSEGVELSKVITLVDSSTFCTDYLEFTNLMDRPELYEGDPGERAEAQVVELLVEQIEASDVVVLNKTDLADSEKLRATHAVVTALNKDAQICETTFGRITLADIMESTSGSHEQSHGHDHEESHAHECCDHGNSTTHEHGHEEVHGHSHESHGDSHESHGQSHESHSHTHGHECHDPECTDPSHGHTHDGNSRSTTAEDRFGITSFTYCARRPFSSERLAEALEQWPVPKDSDLQELLAKSSAATVDGTDESPFAKVIRSKGFCWHEDYPSTKMFWSHAGKSLGFQFEGIWWGVLGKDELQKLDNAEDLDSEYHRAKREDWSDEWQDRRQEIVFIGQRMDEARIRKTLDACLLEDSELEPYRKRQESDAEDMRHEWLMQAY